MRCKYENAGAASGVCTTYFSIEDGVNFYLRSEYDHFLCKSMYAENASTFVFLI